MANEQERPKIQGQNRRVSLGIDDDDEDMQNTGLSGYQFVYPFGCTFMVNHPAIKILTSGPISYPVNKALAAYCKTKNGGSIIVLGSYEMISDNYIGLEENIKFVNFLKAVFLKEEFKPAQLG